MPDRWPTKLPVYRCPPNCGLCCTNLLIEATADDVLREPRINEVYPLNLSAKRRELPVLGFTWVLSPFTGEKVTGCRFMDADKRCGIYATRPSTCLGFPAGGERCQRLRADAGFEPLEPQQADGSISDRIAAEIAAMSEEDFDG
jgi:Fe-S-cluster containining protein